MEQSACFLRDFIILFIISSGSPTYDELNVKTAGIVYESY
jgi:hypothetical protein